MKIEKRVDSTKTEIVLIRKGMGIKTAKVLTFLLGLSLAFMVIFMIASICHAQFYKCTDANGTLHFSDSPANLSEAERKGMKQIPVDKHPIGIGPSALPIRPMESEEREIDQPKERSRQPEMRSQNTRSPGYVDTEKYIHVTEGMTEAEVLSRLGSPTTVQVDQAQSSWTGSGVATSLIKRYYYVGSHYDGERTTVIHIKDGIVFKIERLL